MRTHVRGHDHRLLGWPRLLEPRRRRRPDTELKRQRYDRQPGTLRRLRCAGGQHRHRHPGRQVQHRRRTRKQLRRRLDEDQLELASQLLRLEPLLRHGQRARGIRSLDGLLRRRRLERDLGRLHVERPRRRDRRRAPHALPRRHQRQRRHRPHHHGHRLRRHDQPVRGLQHVGLQRPLVQLRTNRQRPALGHLRRDVLQPRNSGRARGRHDRPDRPGQSDKRHRTGHDDIHLHGRVLGQSGGRRLHLRQQRRPRHRPERVRSDGDVPRRRRQQRRHAAHGHVPHHDARRHVGLHGQRDVYGLAPAECRDGHDRQLRAQRHTRRVHRRYRHAGHARTDRDAHGRRHPGRGPGHPHVHGYLHGRPGCRRLHT